MKTATEDTFSQQEMRCVKLLVLGCTSQEIAKHLNLSQRTVESYLDQTKLKIDARNKVELAYLFTKLSHEPSEGKRYR